ncbi:MAG: outer membrane beta-barrel domain-containing protein [Acidiferrobacterales bacterium]
MHSIQQARTGTLALTFLAALALLTPGECLAQSEKSESEAPEQVIEPEIDRRDIKIPRIDTENFELGLYTGILSVEDFGADGVTGLRFDYHVTEDFFLELAYAESTVSDSSFRRFGAPIFPMEEEELTYYNISFGWNVFPGEIFFGKKRALTSAVYVIAGIGNTEFIGEDMTTLNVGIGFRLLPTDWLSLRIDVRDYIWDSDVLGENKRTHNFEATFGIGIFF